MKKCTRCKKEKPFSAFNKNRRQPDGHDIWCYECKTDNRLQKTYGITSADYERMFAEQGGVCKLCGSEPRRKRLDIDHCHATGKVRALLCENCNRGLGCFNDNPKLMQNALDYLHEHSQRPDVQPAVPDGKRCKAPMEGGDLQA